MIRAQIFRRGELRGDVTGDGADCFLGRDEGSLVPLSGWRIGRRQVQLQARDGGLFIKDGGGIAPIKVNGSAINQYGPVASTDVVEVGDYTMRFHLTEAALTAPAAHARERQ